MHNEKPYAEFIIEKVTVRDDGWTTYFDGGWSFWVKASSPVPPAVGMVIKLYGDGFGHPVRGLMLDGQMIFYKTKEEYDVAFKAETYGASAEEWHQRWEDGKTVWSVEMGGLGPGYEQCIQVTAAAILGYLLRAKPDMERAEKDKEYWSEFKAGIDATVEPLDKKLGLSGAAFHAAGNLAMCLYRRGPVDALSDPKVKNRLIQVSKNFPSA